MKLNVGKNIVTPPYLFVWYGILVFRDFDSTLWEVYYDMSLEIYFS